LTTIDTYTLAPLSASLAVIAGCVIITFVGIKALRRVMIKDAVRAESNQ